MTSQQAAAMLHAAGVTGDYQQLHYSGIADQGDEGYTAAVVLLEAAGLVGEHYTSVTEKDSDAYDVMRFVTDNGSIVVSAPKGSVDRFSRRMVMTPADRLADVDPFDDRVALTELGAQTLAGLRGRVTDETTPDPALD